MKSPHKPELTSERHARQARLAGAAGVVLIASIVLAASAWLMQLVSTRGSTPDELAKTVSGVSLTATPTGKVASQTSSVAVTGGAGSLDGHPPTQAPDPRFPLLGRRIALDPGHGVRGDLGAVLLEPDSGSLILSEAEFNLDVALRCREILVGRGASVILTREVEDTLTTRWPADANDDGTSGDAADDLQTRIDIINDFDAEVFLSIHANGGERLPELGRDVQVIYCGAADCPFPVESKLLGQMVLGELTSRLDAAASSWKGGALLTDLEVDSSNPPLHMFILGPANPPRHVRSTNVPGVLAESLYVTSASQGAELKKSSVREAIALAYADALQSYLLAAGPGGTRP